MRFRNSLGRPENSEVGAGITGLQGAEKMNSRVGLTAEEALGLRHQEITAGDTRGPDDTISSLAERRGNWAGQGRAILEMGMLGFTIVPRDSKGPVKLQGHEPCSQPRESNPKSSFWYLPPSSHLSL